MATTAELIRLLNPKSTTSERVRGLLAAGLRAQDIAAAAGVSVSALRNWTGEQAEPRRDAELVLDDLRATVKTLLEGGIEPSTAGRWLKSRNSDNERPIDLLCQTPMQVLAAAHREVLDVQTERAKDEPTLKLAHS